MLADTGHCLDKTMSFAQKRKGEKMDDRISRQAAIEAATYGNPQTAWQRIEALPSAQPERWIPCSESLPEKCNYYIVTDFGSVEEAYYNSDGRWFSRHDDKLKDVTAWMPLPSPYKGEQE